MTKRAGYRQAIYWIAMNDEDWNTSDIEFTAALITVQLVADLWGKTAEEVAEAVLRCRRRNRQEFGRMTV